jgi:hypothetical protein
VAFRAIFGRFSVRTSDGTVALLSFVVFLLSPSKQMLDDTPITHSSVSHSSVMWSGFSPKYMQLRTLAVQPLRNFH